MRLLRLRLPFRFGGRVATATAALAALLLVILRAMPPPSPALTPVGKLLALALLLGLSALGAMVFFATLRLLGGLEDVDRRRLLEMRFPGQALLARVL